MYKGAHWTWQGNSDPARKSEEWVEINLLTITVLMAACFCICVSAVVQWRRFWTEKYVMSAPYVLNRVRQSRPRLWSRQKQRRSRLLHPFSPPAFPEQILFLPYLLKGELALLTAQHQELCFQTLVFFFCRDVRQCTRQRSFVLFGLLLDSRPNFEILRTPRSKWNPAPNEGAHVPISVCVEDELAKGTIFKCQVYQLIMASDYCVMTSLEMILDNLQKKKCSSRVLWEGKGSRLSNKF